MNEYQPGVCNIGRSERRKRRRFGTMSFLAAAAFVGFVLATGRPDSLLSLAVAPLFGGFLGLFQDRLGFCVGFAAMARYDLSGSSGGAGSVAQREALRADRKRAAQVLAYALVTAVAVTGAVYGLGLAL